MKTSRQTVERKSSVVYNFWRDQIHLNLADDRMQWVRSNLS